MINTTALIGFAIMSLRTINPEVSEGWKPSAKDAQELEEKMKKFAAKVVNGRKQYPFELYLESKDVISFNEFGQIQVKNPIMYDRLNRTESLREWIAGQELEKIFAAFPEEKEAHDKKMRSLVSSFKAVDKSVGA
jgi:hypothetical protein